MNELSIEVNNELIERENKMKIEGLDLDMMIIPEQSKKACEWTDFSEKVYHHIEAYVVAQYGDKGSDNVTEWSAEDCIKQIQKYTNRFGKNKRLGQAEMDLMKIAHYAQMAWTKSQENKIKPFDETATFTKEAWTKLEEAKNDNSRTDK